MKPSINDIDKYLQEVNRFISCNRYQIDRNPKRADNIALFDNYVIDEKDAKEILLNLTPYDFSEVRNNDHTGYEHELLYVFGKDVKLLERYGDKEKTVSLYIKFNKLENRYVIVISFHEQKFPLKYCFK